MINKSLQFETRGNSNEVWYCSDWSIIGDWSTWRDTTFWRDHSTFEIQTAIQFKYSSTSFSQYWNNLEYQVYLAYANSLFGMIVLIRNKTWGIWLQPWNWLQISELCTINLRKFMFFLGNSPDWELEKLYTYIRLTKILFLHLRY